MPDQESSLARHLAGLTDPRVDRTRLHQLLDIVTTAICAVAAGADTREHIEPFAGARQEWIKAFLALPNGVPSHDTTARVFARLDPAPMPATPPNSLPWSRTPDRPDAEPPAALPTFSPTRLSSMMLLIPMGLRICLFRGWPW